MSGLPFELLLALRYLRPKRTFVSVITLISVLGVALGVAVLIIVISVMSGFDQQMRDTVLGFNAHLKISQTTGLLTNYPSLIRTLAKNPRVKSSAPIVFGQVLVQSSTKDGESRVYAPWVRGVDPELEPTVSTLPTSIVAGKFDVSGRGLLIGASFAENMHLKIGDRVNITSPNEIKQMIKTRNQANAEIFVPDEYEVRGIFDVGWEEYNASIVAVSLENAQEMYQLGDHVHALIVKLHDPFEMNVAKRELTKTLGPDFEVLTWLESNSTLAAVMVEKNLMLYILFFIIIVAAFGITCTTITFTVMKTREIGLLKAIGATSRQVMWVFMGQSLIVSLWGIASGTGLGLLAVYYRNEFLELMRRITGFRLFPADVYQLSQLPAKIVPGDIAIICGGSLLICLAAAAFPARSASKLNPVEALRYE